MRLYHRFTNSETALSDWGHAMFAADILAVEGYGENHFTYDGRDGVEIYDIYDDIVAAWERDKEADFFGDWGMTNGTEWAKTVSGEEIADGFIPADVVDSAENWDIDLVQWIWERVLDPMAIMAVYWDAGAIVFDPDLIKREDE